MGPIMAFESQSDLDACLKWWQEKLFLTDWVISAKVIPQRDFSLEESCGESLITFESKQAVVHLMDANDYPSDQPVVYCQEKVLVHELLHCKYDFIAVPNNSYEWLYIDVLEHQKLDDMAKTLVIVKYGIGLDWFKNG